MARTVLDRIEHPNFSELLRPAGDAFRQSGTLVAGDSLDVVTGTMDPPSVTQRLISLDSSHSARGHDSRVKSTKFTTKPHSGIVSFGKFLFVSVSRCRGCTRSPHSKMGVLRPGLSSTSVCSDQSSSE